MITILGASGKVGSKVTENLLAKGKKVRLIARHADKLQKYSEQGAELKIGDSIDASFLTEAFRGSDVVLTMIPADYTNENFVSYQNKLGDAQIKAIKDSGVKKVVFLSSVGGHTEENTGVVAGLARQEKRLRALENVDVKILRPTYFMENLFGNIDMIKNMGIAGGNIKADRSMPFIATQDIAEVASEYLLNPTFTGKSVRPLLGSKNYTMNEVTTQLGKAIGKPDLKYVHFSYDDVLQGMMSMGFSKSVASGMIELGEGINLGIFDNEERNSESTTKTSIEEFAKTFSYVYNM